MPSPPRSFASKAGLESSEKRKPLLLRNMHDRPTKLKFGSASLPKIETIPSIFFAIFRKDYALFKAELSILSQDHINSLTYAGQTPLHATCSLSDLEMTQLLLEKGANVATLNSFGSTALHDAVTQSWTEGVQELLRYGANPDAMNSDNSKVKEIVRQTPFHIAVKAGNTSLVSIILKFKPNMTLKDGENNSILHLAALSRSSHLIKIILKSVNSRSFLKTVNDHGNTPLHSLMNIEKATEADDEALRCCKILITEGAELDSANLQGETPLYLACLGKLHQVVEYLLKQGADPTILTKRENSVLHASCQSGCPLSLKYILNTGQVAKLIMKEDNEGQSPFHKAVNSYSIDCCELLLNNGDHLTNKDSNGVSRCSLVLCNMPNVFELLTRIFDASTLVSSNQIHDPSFRIIFDYAVILAKGTCDSQNCLIREITTPRFESLLKHPLLESFLYIKWGRLKPFFYLGVLNFSLFLLVHTSFVMTTYGGEKVTDWGLEENQSILIAFKSLYIIFCILIIIPDFIIVFTNYKKYLLQYETYSKLITLSTAGFLIFAAPLKGYDNLFQRNLAAISVLFGWFELMLFLGRFPTYGVYILMFLRVSKSIIKFLVAFSFLLIGYACAFSILFYDVESFKNLPLTILKTLMMMVGEIEYGDIYQGANLTRLFETGSEFSHTFINDILRLILLTSFLFLVPILMANLLIGLAVNDIPDLRRQGKIRRLAKQASYIVAYERLMDSFKTLFCFPGYLRKMLVNQYTIGGDISIYPNKKNQNSLRHFTIPSETLREAIIVGAKIDQTSMREDICHIKLDIETQFKEFLKQYNKNQISLETRLMKITNKMSVERKLNSLLQSIESIQKDVTQQKALLSKLSEKT